MELNKIIQGDCLEVMKDIDNKIMLINQSGNEIEELKEIVREFLLKRSK
jgi:DNA modification methylase